MEHPKYKLALIVGAGEGLSATPVADPSSGQHPQLALPHAA